MNQETTNTITVHLRHVLSYRELKPFQTNSFVLSIPRDKCLIHQHGLSIEIQPLQQLHIPYHNIRFFVEDVLKTQPKALTDSKNLIKHTESKPKKETNKKKK